MICIYHSRDLDGYTSGAIVKRKYPDAKLIGYDYGQPVPYDQINPGETVIMIDVSLIMTEMLKLSEHLGSFENLIWIDHHISAIKEYEAFMTEREEHCPFLTAILENGIAACEVGWKYLFPNELLPNAVLLLGEYDTWRNGDKLRWEEEILPMQFGMRLHCNSPETFPKGLIYPNYKIESGQSIGEIIEQGKTILKYQAMVNESQCERSAFEIDFEGLRAICLNGGGFNSDVFKSIYDENKHDLMMPFQFNGKQWTISLYTTKDEIDCSEIARRKGGGGHKKAAGFQVKNIDDIVKKGVMEIEFSIIMASKLENYYGGAVDRVSKFKRAVDSVTSQNFKSWELIIVSDNCMVTMDTVLDTYNDSPGIVGFFLPGKRALFNGLPRNTGIESARGQWIIYLDTDDSFAPGYLSDLSRAIRDNPNPGGIYWVHDLIYSGGGFIQRRCMPLKGKCGTSNIIHPASTEVRWVTQGQYAHDWMFIKSLKAAHGSGVLLEPTGYKVHHIPGRYDI